MNNKGNVTRNTPALIPWQAPNSPLITRRTHRTYTEDERQNILKRYFDLGESVIHMIAETQIPKSTIYNWIRTRQKELNAKKAPVYNARTFFGVQNKMTKLENIVTILKTANYTVQAPLKRRLQLAESFTKKYNVQTVCEALNIPKGTYYNHMLRNKKTNVWYTRRREELRVRIKEIYDESNQIFGTPKIVAVLRSQGIRSSKKLVGELMQEMGLISIRRGAKKFHEDSCKKRPNYINQNFDTTAPNQVWVSDVTYFKYDDTPYYICAILDLFARRVIGYKIGPSNSTQLVKSTIRMAYEQRKPTEQLLFHTDRGDNYCSKRVAEYLKSLNIVHSYSRAHIPYDNSVMETFFSSMKREELYRRTYHSKSEFFKAVDTYVQFYNTKRPHAKLQYKTPEEKEAEFLANTGDTDN